jgi:hypothetical protein
MPREDYVRWMRVSQHDDENATGAQLALDELAQGVAEGTISRGRALKLTGAAILGSTGLLSLFPAVAGAQATCGPSTCCQCEYAEPGTNQAVSSTCFSRAVRGCGRRRRRRLSRRCMEMCELETPPGLVLFTVSGGCNPGTTGTQDICVQSSLGSRCDTQQCG